jgi:hypothetical protein
MLTSRSRATLRAVVAGGLVLAGAIAWDAAGRPAQTASANPAAQEEPPAPFKAPARSGTARPPPIAVPDVPHELATAPAVTADVETRVVGRRGRALRKTITRAADRVHVSIGPRGPEWLFVRNPVDPRRMTATLIDHDHEILIEYDESELRNSGVGRGWADVAGLGVQPEDLRALRATGRSRRIAGLRASERALPRGARGRVRQLWWSDQAAAPLLASVEDGASRGELRVRRLRLAADESLLQDPRVRYPSYRVMDVHDHREEHHEKSGDNPAPSRDHE